MIKNKGFDDSMPEIIKFTEFNSQPYFKLDLSRPFNLAIHEEIRDLMSRCTGGSIDNDNSQYLIAVSKTNGTLLLLIKTIMERVYAAEIKQDEDSKPKPFDILNWITEIIDAHEEGNGGLEHSLVSINHEESVQVRDNILKRRGLKICPVCDCYTRDNMVHCQHCEPNKYREEKEHDNWMDSEAS